MEKEKEKNKSPIQILEKYKQIVEKSSFSSRFKRIQESNWKKEKIEGVLGNPSCDQDSFIGSHVLGVSESRLSIVNMPRKIFECKKDLLMLTEVLGCSLEDLVFLEEEEAVLVKGKDRKKIEEMQLTVTLIDHNLPRKSLFLKTFSVDRIIDHHPILEMHPFYSKLQRINIELNAGSCCALIYRDILSQRKKEIKENPNAFSYLLLLSLPVITDTSFLTNRTHPVDKEAVEDLLAANQVSSDEANEMYKSLKNRKKCEEDIPMDLILLMDYKSFEYPPGKEEKTFGISSVGYPFDEWLKRDKENFLKQIEDLRNKRKHEFFLVNSKSRGVREFFLLPGKHLKDVFTSAFVQEVLFNGEEIKKREVAPGILVYTTDPKLSRKLVAPRIYHFLQKHPQ